jgi:hypothetical protein
MEWPDDMSEHAQKKLNQIPDRDILSRAWVKACLHQKSVVSLQWINDEMASTDSNTTPPTPGSTTTPAAKRHQPNNNHLNDMSITPTAKPARLEFTLEMPNKRNVMPNKRSNRSYSTPAKSTNDSKRATKKDDHTPLPIKELKKKQQSQSTTEHHKIPHKSKKKIPKKASKSHKCDKKKATKKTKTKRGGKKKNHQLQARMYSNKATP